MLKDDVLNRFHKYKDDYKLTNIIYGIKAIAKMASVFHPDNKSSRNKWIKRMKNKSDNCVYFVYNHIKKGKSHRFLAKNSDLGESFNKSKTIKKRKSVKKKIMKGGFCPCALAPASALIGAGIAGCASIIDSFSSSSSSSSRSAIKNGKIINSSEKIKFQKNINGKKTKRKISRKGKLVKIGKQKIKSDSISSAKMLYDNLIEKYLN